MAGFYLWRVARASGLVCFTTVIFSDACASKPSTAPAPETAGAPAAAASMKGAENPPTYFEFQIEKPAQRILTTGYPSRPASENGQAQVLVQFVVDTAGVPLMRTFKVLHSTSESSSFAVREALKKIRYYPAEINGKRVYQLVQEEFVF
jgi:outer membrane biosynthesis protein TonB